MDLKLKIKIPPEQKRPEDEFKAIFTNPESVVEMRLGDIIQQLRNSPVWVAQFIQAMTDRKEAERYGFVRVNSGAFKTIFRMGKYAVAIEREKDRSADAELYKRLDSIKGCPGIVYPTQVWYWAKFKLTILNYCMDGDLANIFPRIGKFIALDSIYRSLYELGFTLLKLHQNGVFPLDIKPENTLYCECNNTKVLTFGDLEECALDSDLIDDKIEPFYMTGFGTKRGRKFFPFTSGYSSLKRYIDRKLPITKMELMYQGWYAYAHMYLECYTYTCSHKTPQQKARYEFYTNKNRRDWRYPPSIGKLVNLQDFIAFKMHKIIISGTGFMANKYTMVNAFKYTTSGDVIDKKVWENYYRDVIEKEYNIQNKTLWEKNLIEEFKNILGN